MVNEVVQATEDAVGVVGESVRASTGAVETMAMLDEERLTPLGDILVSTDGGFDPGKSEGISDISGKAGEAAAVCDEAGGVLPEIPGSSSNLSGLFLCTEDQQVAHEITKRAKPLVGRGDCSINSSGHVGISIEITKDGFRSVEANEAKEETLLFTEESRETIEITEGAKPLLGGGEFSGGYYGLAADPRSSDMGYGVMI